MTTDKIDKALERAKEIYLNGDIDELYEIDVKDLDPTLSIEDVFILYMMLANWSMGDEFYRKIGTSDGEIEKFDIESKWFEEVENIKVMF